MADLSYFGLAAERQAVAKSQLEIGSRNCHDYLLNCLNFQQWLDSKSSNLLFIRAEQSY